MSQPSHKRDEAEDLYLAALESTPEGELPDLRQLLAARPDLADELASLEQEHSWLEGFGATRPPAVARPDADSLLARLVDGVHPERYQVEAELARGGMGTIYRVWDSYLARYMAMKVSAHSDSESGSKSRRTYRFLEEAQALGRLDHPGVPPVYDIGRTSTGEVYFTMRLIRGQTLQAHFRQLPGAPRANELAKALRILERVCETVAYAHGVGIIHRDLKPANIMVAELGETYVMDWGLARIVHGGFPVDGVDLSPEEHESAESAKEDAMLTMAGDVLGTPSYMPPEQARGELARIDERSDVYAIGAILYHLLAGQPPYFEATVSGASDGDEDKSKSKRIVEAVRRGAPQALSRLVPQAPPEVVAICERAMARAPEDRYPHAQALGEDLRATLENRVVQAVPKGPLTAGIKWIQRNRLAASALACAMVLGLAMALVYAAVEGRRNRDLSQANTELTGAREGAEATAYAARLAAAQGALRSGRMAEARQQLQSCPPDRRGFEWDHFQALLEGHNPAFDGDLTAEPWCMTAGGEGLLVVGLADGAIEIRSSADGSRVIRIESPSPVVGLAFVGHGQEIASVHAGGELCRFALGDGTELARSRLDSIPQALAASPDGQLLAIGVQDGSARIWDLENWEERAQTRGHGWYCQSVQFSPDGERLLSTGGDNAVRLWDVATAAESGHAFVMDPNDRERHRWKAIFDSEGARIVCGTWDGKIRVLDAKSLTIERVIQGHSGHVFAVALDSEDRLLASVSMDQRLSVWDLDTGLKVYQAGHFGSAVDVLWDPEDGQLLSAGQDRMVRRWDLDSDTGPTTLPKPHGGSPGPVAAHPGGEQLAVSTTTGYITIYDQASGNVQQCVPTKTSWDIAISSDGAWLASGSDTGVEVWSTADYSYVGHIPTGAPVSWLASRPGGSSAIAASTTGGTVLFLDPAGLSVAGKIELASKRAVSIAYSADGQVLWTSSPANGVQGWDSETQALLHSIPSTAGAQAIAYSPTESEIAVAIGSEIHLFHPSTGELLGSMAAHTLPIIEMAYHPTGDRLASGSEDRSVILWDTGQRNYVATLGFQRSWAYGIAWAPDGSWLASTGAGTVLYEQAPIRRRLRVVRERMPSLRSEMENLLQEHLTLEPALIALAQEPDLSEAERRAGETLLHCLAAAPYQARKRLRSALETSGLGQVLSKRALGACSRLAKQFVQEPDWIVLQGIAHYRLGQDAAAQASLESVYPSLKGQAQIEATILLARIAARRGQVNRALELRSRLIALLEVGGNGPAPELDCWRAEWEAVLALGGNSD